MTPAAIADGDYRGAGRVGIQTLIIGITTAITLGEGAAALAGGKGTGAAAIANGEKAVLNEGVKPFQVGRFNDLQRGSHVGDNLALHHAGQKHAMKQAIPSYDANSAPAIALPTAQHRAIPNLTGNYSGSARDLLARDIRNLRNFTDAPNSSLKELIQLNKELYPGAFAK